MRRFLPIILLAYTLLLPTGCDTIDCTLYNIVSCQASFYANGGAVSITDVLDVKTCGIDSVLVNQQSSTETLNLPLSYWQETDTLVFIVTGEGYALMDTVWIDKENTPHFESPDCPSTMFHHIRDVRTTHTFIDSVTIVQPLVNYDQTDNLQIHVRTGN